MTTRAGSRVIYKTSSPARAADVKARTTRGWQNCVLKRAARFVGAFRAVVLTRNSR